MREVILQGLMITIIGMGLVFVVIIFLWWLMGVLVKVTTREKEQESLTPLADDGMGELLAPEVTAMEAQRKAAAAAVGVGLALAASRALCVPCAPEDKMGALSPWQNVHRARQLERQHKRG